MSSESSKIYFKCSECPKMQRVRVKTLEGGKEYTLHRCRGAGGRTINPAIIYKDIPLWCPDFPL